MEATLTFSKEIANLLYAQHGNPLKDCIQCGTCSGSCPAVEYMDQTPRQLIAMINADMENEVMSSNTYWSCASCYQCNVRCPAGIDIAGMMYGLKRYSMWKVEYKEGLVGPEFSETFMKMILRTGRSFEPVLAPTYVFKLGAKDMFQEALMATSLFFKGRMSLVPKRIKRLENFRNVVKRIIPFGGIA